MITVAGSEFICQSKILTARMAVLRDTSFQENHGLKSCSALLVGPFIIAEWLSDINSGCLRLVFKYTA
jgi:hypothetical protein